MRASIIDRRRHAGADPRLQNLAYFAVSFEHRATRLELPIEAPYLPVGSGHLFGHGESGRAPLRLPRAQQRVRTPDVRLERETTPHRDGQRRAREERVRFVTARC